MKNPADRKVSVIDTTMRDGEQAPGVSFTLKEKCEIAKALDQTGIDEIEAGIPAMGDVACHEIKCLARLNLSCTLSCWCRAKIQDIELSARCGTPGAHISFPTSSILLKTFDKTEVWVLDQLQELVRFADRHFDWVSVGAQDATRTSHEFLVRFAQASHAAGAQRLRLADTVGMINPTGVIRLVSGLSRQVPGLDLEFHGHNDLGMATANAVTAIDAGAAALSVTVNGLGERAGNAPLEEVVMALFEIGAYTKKIDFSWLLPLCHLVAAASGRTLPSAKPVVGTDMFRHESGIHSHALLKDPSAYQLITPDKIGKDSFEYVIGAHSGSAAVKHILTELGFSPEKNDITALLPQIREIARQKKNSLTREELVHLYNAQTTR